MHTVDFHRDDAGDTPPNNPVRSPALPAPVTSWLQRVEAAAHPQPKLTDEVKDPKVIQYKFVYVMAPTSVGQPCQRSVYFAVGPAYLSRRRRRRPGAFLYRHA
jgi:hypothetical protein